jgi:hypothetical protein
MTNDDYEKPTKRLELRPIRAAAFSIATFGGGDRPISGTIYNLATTVPRNFSLSAQLGIGTF